VTDTRAFVHDEPASRVVFGVGAVANVPGEVDRLGGRVLLVHGRHSAGYADALAGGLDARLVARIDDVVMHVPVGVADAAVRLTRESGADVVVCLGGGSATGLAKAVARDTGVPVLAVPTTYAGSEMSPIWGITEHDIKSTGRDPRVRPRTVVYDPALTVSLPVDLSAASGMNAIAHCIEALYAANASPVVAVLAGEGLRILGDALPRVVTDPADLAARSDAMYGAWLGGWVLGSAAMGIHHKICHVLGGSFGMPHAQTHSAVLPYAVAFNAPFAPEAMARASRALGDEGATGDVGVALWRLASSIGAPTSLAALGLDRAGANAAADLIAQSPTVNPRPIEWGWVRELLLQACDGRQPE
jgi:maleylacetate reductase